MPKKKKETDLSKLPVYEIVIDPEDLTTGIKMVSLLSDPAIEVQGMAFKKGRKWGLVTPPCHFADPDTQLIPNCQCDIVYSDLLGDHEWILGETPCDFCVSQKAYWDSLNTSLRKQEFGNYKKKKQHNFSADREQKLVAGPVLIPDLKIFRRDDETGAEYFVKFAPAVIHQLVEKFNRGNNNRAINIDHTNQMAPAFIKENWLVADPVYDKSKVFGYDLPKDTWFWVVKIEDDAFWEQQVKGEGKHSFSIQGMLGQKLVEMALGKALNVPEMLAKLELDELIGFAFETLLKTKP